MSIGPILGTGGLAIIIPPSALAVLLATLAQIDVGALLIAGVIPGLILAALYLGRSTPDPDRPAAPRPAYEVTPIVCWVKSSWLLMRDVVPMIGLMVVIVAMMINGIVTPSEAAAFGALGVLILAVIYRCLNWAVIEAVHPRRAEGDADGLSDRVRLGDLQPVARLFRRLARADQMGNRVRTGSSS